MKKRKIIIVNIILIFIAIIMCFGGGISCCLNYGYGLGDLAYLIPLFIFTVLYPILLLIFYKKSFHSIVPPIIFILVLSFFIFTLIFDRGPECSCDLFN